MEVVVVVVVMMTVPLAQVLNGSKVTGSVPPAMDTTLLTRLLATSVVHPSLRLAMC